MNRIVEIIALSLGGVSLFAVCFTAFATLAGVPMHDVAVIGKFFDPPQTLSQDEETAEPVPVEEPEERTEEDLITSNMGVLSAWSLPSPYSSAELQALAEEIKLQSFRVDQQREELEAREMRVQEQVEDVTQRFEMLETMRKNLEAYEAELNLRSQEVRRDESAKTERRDRRYSEVARLVENLESDAASSLLAEYSPPEAASILRSLDASLAAELLAALRNEPAIEDWKAYVDAYSEAGPSGS